MNLTIFTDGGSRGNPGPAAYGFSIKDDLKELAGVGKYIGIDTNNVAEYSAVVEALKWVKANRELLGEISGINFFMDSELISRQLNGQYKVKHPVMQSLFHTVQTLLSEISLPTTFTHVRRENNKRADALVNEALDKELYS
ncbi:MAG TPA: ribonuclease HI family protein [Patescibacteria group bacterium]